MNDKMLNRIYELAEYEILAEEEIDCYDLNEQAAYANGTRDGMARLAKGIAISIEQGE